MRFIWDGYSDQPYPLKDKALKKTMRLKVWFDHLKVGLTNLLVAPVVFLNYFRGKPKISKTDEFFGLGVNIDREPDIAVRMVKELGVDHVLIRFPLCKTCQLESYLSFVKKFQGKKIVLNLLQSRDLIENPQEFEKVLTTVFRKFAPWVDAFQVANAVNRTKWGFFSIDEYLRFYQVAYQLKEKNFKEITDLLLENGAAAGENTRGIWTSRLFTAVQKGDAETAADLVNKSININAKNPQGEPLISILVVSGNKDLVETLIQEEDES